jgi:hypothetical protein
MTQHRPKPWGKRAEPDGSCKPKIRRIKIGRHTPHQVWIERACFFGMSVLFAGILGSYLYFQAASIGVLATLGIPFSMDGFWNALHALRHMVWVVAIVGLVWVANTYLGVFFTRRKVIAHRCLICPRCGYDLRNRINDSEPCSECGQMISRRECRRLWCKFLRSWI